MKKNFPHGQIFFWVADMRVTIRSPVAVQYVVNSGAFHMLYLDIPWEFELHTSCGELVRWVNKMHKYELPTPIPLIKYMHLF